MYSSTKSSLVGLGVVIRLLVLVAVAVAVVLVLVLVLSSTSSCSALLFQVTFCRHSMPIFIKKQVWFEKSTVSRKTLIRVL